MGIFIRHDSPNFLALYEFRDLFKHPFGLMKIFREMFKSNTVSVRTIKGSNSCLNRLLPKAGPKKLHCNQLSNSIVIQKRNHQDGFFCSPKQSKFLSDLLRTYSCG